MIGAGAALALAAELAPLAPTRVLASADGDDATLAGIVADALECAPSLVSVRGGYACLQTPVIAADRVVIVSERVRSVDPLAPLRDAVSAAGAVLVAVGTLAGSPVLRTLAGRAPLVITPVARRRPQSSAMRLGAMLGALSQISDHTGGDGVTRLGYSAQERRAHALVAGWARELGLRVWEDAAGNTIAALPGRLPAIAIGSHLDSVPCGGRFDGVAGVVAGLEVVRQLRERDIAPRQSVRVVAFACEEGARFGRPCLGSGAAAGALERADAEELADHAGIALSDAMRTVGLDPCALSDARWNRQEWGAFFELHIEQGQVLEHDELEIGLVSTVTGSTRYELVITGTSGHSGTTPMSLRADALNAAAEIALAAETVALACASADIRCTVGRFEVRPGAVTTIPGEVAMSLDVRGSNDSRQRSAAAQVLERARVICARRRVSLATRQLAHTPPVALSPWLREITERECSRDGLRYRVMTSGASHDAQVINGVVPAAMIFVPSARGVSHSPTEWSSPHLLACGTDLLLRSVLALDEVLSARAQQSSTGTP